MHRTIQNTSRLIKVVRTVGITLAVVAGSASAASAVTGGSFVPSLRSEPTTPAATTTPTTKAPTPTTTKAPEPTPTTKAPTPTTTKAPEPTPTTNAPTPTTTNAPEPTTAKAPEPTPTTKAPTPPTTKAPEPTTVKTPTPTPTPTTAKAPEPTPTTATTKAPEVRTPEALQLACERQAEGDKVRVVCSWTGDLPAGGTNFVLLRSGGGVGRVLVSGPNAHNFVDSTIQAGVTYSYVAVVLGAPGSATLAHSNPVSITG